jgi:hypothetical protein
MIRLILLWLLITVVSYVLKYVFSKEEVISFKILLKRILFCGIISTVLVSLIYFLNNIQGV